MKASADFKKRYSDVIHLQLDVGRQIPGPAKKSGHLDH
jgi:hypothetical protein